MAGTETHGCKKKPSRKFRDHLEHTPLSIEEKMPVMEQVKLEAQRRKIRPAPRLRPLLISRSWVCEPAVPDRPHGLLAGYWVWAVPAVMRRSLTRPGSVRTVAVDFGGDTHRTRRPSCQTE
ncbi:MAG TPA: hypothetical protein VGJ36_06650 [Gemmatimonadales bacterium]